MSGIVARINDLIDEWELYDRDDSPQGDACLAELWHLVRTIEDEELAERRAAQVPEGGV